MTSHLCRHNQSLVALLAACCLFLFPDWASARNPVDSSRLAAPASAAQPAYCMTQHRVGRIGLTINNFGRFGTESRPPYRDCFTGERVHEAEYPIGSGTIYLYKGGLWIGAVVGEDSLVSTTCEDGNLSREFHPDEAPFGHIIRRSNLDADEQKRAQAVSEEDIIATYTDTFVFGVPNQSFDMQDARFHEPLGLEVVQNSYAWSFGYADDIILVDYVITNIGDKDLRNVFIGIFMDHDAAVYAQNVSPRIDGSYVKGSVGGDDDVTGIFETWPLDFAGCDFEDTLNLAWTADNDGEPFGINEFAVPNVLGMRFLIPPDDNQRFSYNWWIPDVNPNLDFGPQMLDNFRLMNGVVGSPYGDRDRYFLMSNGEIDYDQIETIGIRSGDPVWVYPGNKRLTFYLSQGNDCRYVTGMGPYQVRAGETFHVPIAIVGGEGWHTYPNNLKWNIRNSYQPERYYSYMRRKEFVQNARWAAWIYDNPGVDTDGDGFAGPFALCVKDSAFIDGAWQPTEVDTVYYRGDGHADWRAAAPPPAPTIWVNQTLRGLHVRWNGQRSENTRDVFANRVDFEGYRVYFARDNRQNSYVMTASYDIENYDKYRFVRQDEVTPRFERQGFPYTIEELRCAYGNTGIPCEDEAFDPLVYTPSSPLIMDGFNSDSIFYFRPHGFNTHEFGQTTDIQKVYPEAAKPGPDPTPDEYTEDGYLKYYEYEYTIDNLLPSVPYFVTVTAFDFGSPESGLLPMESSRTLDPVEAYAASSPDQLENEQPAVYVYPNPYVGDGQYAARGFEGRNSPFSIPDRIRQITFVNVPPKATISVYSLDGDLVRRFKHDKDPSDPTYNHATWDMISRNRQMIVTGIYYWTVENDETGEVQIGKLVVIM